MRDICTVPGGHFSSINIINCTNVNGVYDVCSSQWVLTSDRVILYSFRFMLPEKVVFFFYHDKTIFSRNNMVCCAFAISDDRWHEHPRIYTIDRFSSSVFCRSVVVFGPSCQSPLACVRIPVTDVGEIKCTSFYLCVIWAVFTIIRIYLTKI